LSAIAAAAVAHVLADCSRPPGEVRLAAPSPVLGRWDRARMEQLVEALVSNALRFGGGHPVRVSVDRVADRAVLTVCDHGIGIPPEHLAGVFARFDRAGVPPAWGGLGLGLYVGRAIVELHGGTIRAESHPASGTKLVVELPLAGPEGGA
jgi:signal transduction histidine kinase